MKNMTITDELLAKYISGQCDKEERASVEKYMAENNENADDVLRMTLSAYSYINGQNESEIIEKKWWHNTSNLFNVKVFYRYAAAIAVLVLVGIGVWKFGSSPQMPYFDLDSSGNGSYNAGFSGNAGNNVDNPCDEMYDYTYSIDEIADEWIWEEDTPFVIEWESDAPMQRLDYRFGSSDEWIENDVSKIHRFSISADEMRSAEQIELRIIVGCNKDNWNTIFDDIIKIRR